MIFEKFKTTNKHTTEKLKKLERFLASPLEADIRIFENIHESSLLTTFESLRKNCLYIVWPQEKTSFFRRLKFAEVSIDVQTVDETKYPPRLLKLDENRFQKRTIMLEMIMEDFSRLDISISSLNPQQREYFIALYFLAEALVLAECGVVNVSNVGNSLRLEKTDSFEQAFYLNWFCGVFCGQSKLSDFIDFREVVGSARQMGKTTQAFCYDNVDVIDRLTLSAIDKVLSLSPKFIHKLPAIVHKPLQILIERARIAVFLQLIWVEAMMKSGRGFLKEPLIFQLTESDLNALKIPIFIWEEMLQFSTSKNVEDRFVHEFDNARYQLGDLSFDQIMNQYCYPLLTMFNGLVGEWFEEEYARHYISTEVSKKHYRVFKGLKAQKGEQPNYDVDFIVEDVEADRLFFCQLKYRQTSRLPFLRNEWREFFIGNQIPHGIEQLQGLKESFDDPIVLEKIRQSTGRRKLDVTYLKTRTSLVLIHNIENFDFQTYDGIVFYEWNSFRNLLKRRSARKSTGQYKTDNAYPSRVPIEDVRATIEFLIKHGFSDPKMLNLEEHWRLFNSAYVVLSWKKRSFLSIFPWRGRQFNIVYPLI